MADCGNCGAELRQVQLVDMNPIEQCQGCLTVWISRDSGAKDPLAIGDLTVPEVRSGAFGPQFTLAERAVLNAAVMAWLEVTEVLWNAGMLSVKVEGRERLRELADRLIS